jgi:hypothetical protein
VPALGPAQDDDVPLEFGTADVEDRRLGH